jgi:uncharacterized protein YjbI with pentapeptide repeats
MDTKLIGNKIADARKKANMSQAKLGQLLFISPQAVGKWERGESVPDIITFNRLAEILGVDLNYFSENFSSVEREIGASAAPVDIDSTEQQSTSSRAQERGQQINLTAVDLQGSDFAGVALHKSKFKTSPLLGANFAGADLTGSSFEVSDAREANFDGANLTDCKFSITELTGASFRKSVLVRTTFDISGQGAKFMDVNMVDVNLVKTDLRTTVFENCVFNGVDFNYCDLRGVSFAGLSFVGVKFDKCALNEASFTGATLKNVTFTLPFSVTNRSYNAIKTICFDGAMMDKLTYAALKGLRVLDLSKVTII